MASWRKRIEAGGGKDLRPGEHLVAGVFLNPDGLTSALVAKELGGAVGSAVAARRGGARSAAEGLAALLPNDRCWLGLTSTRLLVWRHGAMRGRPTDLITEMPAADLVGVELTKRKATHAVSLTFADGSVRTYEAPKLMNEPEHFAATVNAT